MDHQAVLVVSEVHADGAARRDLTGRNHGGQRLGELPVDGTVQLTRAVLRAGPRLQQKFTALLRHLDREASLSQPIIDVILQLPYLMLENRSQRFGVKRLI